jgi:RHS repeat-associated protein
LAKGGGAIRGIGEKFAANPVTGTGSLTVPIYTNPGRSGFGPHLALSYDSGAGNGPFGFGWSLSLPSITRKTDKGLPKYLDQQESDVFILSNAEDLVPVLVANNGKWERQSLPPRSLYDHQYEIRRYRPRIEGLFARIERWRNVSNPQDTFWRSISKDNITTWYGKTKESRIADPADPGRVFTWLICESYDDKGNVISYRYKPENSDGVDLSQAHERNRTASSRSANRYLKHVFYGNGTPYFPDLTASEPKPLPEDWCFELVFDYGEHDEKAPVPQETGKPWNLRADPFSTYRAAFEIRTYRLCRRALMFHHFADERGVGLDCLVRSTDLAHKPAIEPPPDLTKPFYSFLLSVTQTGYRRNNRGYLAKALPPLEFTYTEAVLDETVRDVDAESLQNLPYGLDGSHYQWVDLDGEGLSGILTEQASSWFYKRNLSPSNLRSDDGRETAFARFAPVELIARQPSFAGLSGGRQQLLDLAGDGQLDLVDFAGPSPGFSKRSEDEDWEPFRPFASLPVLKWGDPNLKFVDVTGDGHADLLISEDQALRWHASLAEAGFGLEQRVPQAFDEEQGPKLLFADGTETIFLADLSGDGLTDLARIRNGEACYWPNLGYGRFGAKITMDNTPWFEAPDLFDGRRLRLADIDGSGTTDIIYFAGSGVQLHFNQSGNAWGEKRTLGQFPPVESVSSANALDLLGNGTACLVWSSPLPGNVPRPMRYIDLMGGQKPHLLVGVVNNLGAETHVQYAPSTKFYIADKLGGTPWITRLPFPVQVVERVETLDYLSRNRFVTRYAYHHGFYDGVEREFRGFGMVEQFDSEEFQAGPTPSANSYNFSTLDFPGGTSTFWQGLNDNNQIVGSQRDANGVFHSVLNDNGTFSTFDPPGFVNTSFPGISSAAAINSKGDIVGSVKNNDDAGEQAYVYVKSADRFNQYNHPDAHPSWETDLRGINDAGTLVGAFWEDANTPHAVRIGSTITLLEDELKLPANKGTVIFDINNLGQMVGAYFDPVGDVQHGFLVDGETFTTIDYPGSSTTWLNSINDSGLMAGAYYDDAAQVWHGFLTDRTGTKFTVLDFPNAPGQQHDTFVSAINNAGRIVGYYGNLAHLNRPGIHGFLATPASPTVALGMSADARHFSPSTCIKTWFHTGAYLGEERISKHFEKEYYHEGDASDAIAGLSNEQLEAMLLDDTVFPMTLLLPDNTRVPYGLTGDERREAARALKGSILRQEIYALDGTDAADRPYTASERNYTIKLLQPQGSNRHAVFFAHARETVDFHYERKLFTVGDDGKLADPNNPPPGAAKAADPRVTHAMTLAVDAFGNVLQSVAIGYGRRYKDPSLTGPDQDKQTAILLTYTENDYTDPILILQQDDAYRIPLPSETRSYVLINLTPGTHPDITTLFRFEDMPGLIQVAGAHEIPYEDVDAKTVPPDQAARRLIERVRTLYRPDDMGVEAGDARALLPLGQLQPLALPGISYKLAFTPGLLPQVYQRHQENLLPVPAKILGSTGGDGGGYVDLDEDGHWWLPSGRVFYHPDPAVVPQQELDQARQHFFLPRRFEDPFGNSATVDYDTHDLLVARTIDAIDNKVAATNDYRVLQPSLVTDPNDNQAAVSFDVLGLLAGTAVSGKTEDIGDSLKSFAPDLTSDQISGFFNTDDPHTVAALLLSTATTRVIYDVDRFKNSRDANPTDPSKWEPVFAATLARETHSSDPPPPDGLKIQISFSYSDGFGREVQKKIQAEPGPVVDGGPIVDPRWVGSGWTIFNNKGKPVRQYEPFFSQLPSLSDRFEFGVKIGVSPILCYDPVERVVATIHPNHTYEKVVFDPWRQDTWDVNDTVALDPKTDPDVGGFLTLLPDEDYLPTWYAQRVGGAVPEEQDAANKAAVHANTPAVAYFDTLGRTFLTVADNGKDAAGTAQKYPTRTILDIEGNQREVRDAVVQANDPQGRIVVRYDYDMLGNRIHQTSMEAGERWMLSDVTGKPIRAWDSRGHMFRTGYDILRRPTDAFVQGADSDSPDREILFEQTLYGEGQPSDKGLNLRARVFKRFDPAGIVTSLGRNPITNQNEAYDFKGNLLRTSREVAADYKGLIDWSVAQPPGEVFSTSTTYDALNRPTTVTTPDESVYRPTYNEANLLETVAVNLRGAATATPFVTNIDYNARGQRSRIDYGNGVSTVYEYDKETFRPINLATQSSGTALQDLHYTYDPAGNITHIHDTAQQTIYFSGQVVEPSCDYTYDAIYRLIIARGREHIGQVQQPETTWDDGFRVNLPHPQDGQAMRNYAEHYEYDPVGNFNKLTRQAVNGGWTRSYAYNEASLLEPAKTSNRLGGTSVGRDAGSNPPTETYAYDAHGNMIQMPHLTAMQWDFKDQLRETSKQAVNTGTPETTFYVYDASGQRTRKVTERQGGSRKEERIHLGGFEVYREYNGNGSAVTLERETLHVMDDKQRIALVETRTGGNDGSPAQLIRYQFGNHLGSASLELDAQAQVISYEEYYPYGSTSFQAVKTAIKAAAKRYRYTSKERDEETGFYYHGARCYTPWIGRWTSCDPAGIMGGIDLYVYAANNPVRHIDPIGLQPRDLIDPRYVGNGPRYTYGARSEVTGKYTTVTDTGFTINGEQISAGTSSETPVAKPETETKDDDGKSKPIPFATTEEQWQVAQESARNWFIDRAIQEVPWPLRSAVEKALAPLRAPEPPEHPTNLRDYELRESYDAMQHALTSAEIAGSIVAGPIAESAAVAWARIRPALAAAARIPAYWAVGAGGVGGGGGSRTIGEGLSEAEQALTRAAPGAPVDQLKKGDKWLKPDEWAASHGNEILKAEKEAIRGTSERSGSAGDPYNAAARKLDELAKTPGLLEENATALRRTAQRYRQTARQLNHPGGTR